MARIAPAQTRFWRHVKFMANGCWEWQASTQGGGYGRIRINGKDVFTHRFAYEQAMGPIPLGLWVLHRCDNPRCVRLAHLELGTPKDNSQDMVRKGRHVGNRKTHCKRGHEFTAENTGRTGTGRCCRKCASDYQESLYWERRAWYLKFRYRPRKGALAT